MTACHHPSVLYHHTKHIGVWHGKCGICVSVQALLAAGQPTQASLCLRVLLESSLESHKQDVLVLLFLVKAGLQTGSIPSLQSALIHARSASDPFLVLVHVGSVRVHVGQVVRVWEALS